MPNIILVRNDYPDQNALRRVINYALRTPIKGGYAVDPDYAFEQMKLIKSAFYKSSGVQLKHFIVSFSAEDMCRLSIDEMMDLAWQICTYLKEYQIVYGIHLDTDHTHIHFVMNTVSFEDGHKFSDGLLPFRKLCTVLQTQYPYSKVHLCCSDSRVDKNFPTWVC